MIKHTGCILMSQPSLDPDMTVSTSNAESIDMIPEMWVEYNRSKKELEGWEHGGWRGRQRK